MVLATHIAVGSAVASLVPNHPIIGFGLAFCSHFLLDAVPHWDYELKSRVSTDGDGSSANYLGTDLAINGKFVRDLFCIGLDVLIGVALAIFILGGAGKLSMSVIVAGALGGILPDFLQFVYMKVRREPLISLQKFHHFVHAKKRIYNPLTGIILQLIIVAAVFILV